MKTLSKLKTLLTALAAFCCVAGFASCNSTPDSSTDPSTDPSIDSPLDSDSSSDSSDSSDDPPVPEQGEYAVYYSTMQAGYSVATAYHDEGETVSLPECQAKTLGKYTLSFKYWANSETDVPVTADFKMPANDVCLYAVYDNGMVSGDRDFELREDGYIALGTAAHGAFNSLSMDSDGDVYSLDITLPAVSTDYYSDCGPTFAAGSYEEVLTSDGYSTPNFKYYLQVFITHAYDRNTKTSPVTYTKNASAGNLVVYIFDESNESARLKTVKLSDLAGTAYYNKFNAWLDSDEESTFTYTVRMDKTNSKFFIGVDGEECITLSLGDTASGKTLTEDYFDHTIVGMRSKSMTVRFNSPAMNSLNDYTFVLDANGGTVNGETEMEMKVSAYDYANLPTPERAGYTFLYWYTYDANGNVVQASADDYQSSAQMKLGGTYYAKWRNDSAPSYTVIFDTDSDYTVPSVSDYQLGDELTVPTLSSALYTFEGKWYYDAARTQEIDFSNIDVTKLTIDTENGTITLYTKATFVLDGEGTETSPYSIATAADLKTFANLITLGETFEGKYLAVTADIDLSGETWTPIPAGFAGTLDGAKAGGGTYAITLVNTTCTTANCGFFAYLTAGTVKNLTLNVNFVSTNSAVGGLAGIVQGSVTAENITVTGTVSGKQNVGGIFAWANASVSTAVITVKNCVNNAAIIASSTSAGGIIGSVNGGSGCVCVSGCSNYGDVSAVGQLVGGVVGIFRARKDGSSGSYVKDCYNYGNVSATNVSSIAFVGGVVGLCRVQMTDCYCLNTATLSYTTSAGATTSQTASACDASVNAGMGYLAGGLVTGTSATGTVVGTVTGGGLCDSNGGAITE